MVAAMGISTTLLISCAETVLAKGVEGPAQYLLDKLIGLTPNDFEIVCAAALRLAGAREMTPLCTGDEGGIDCYGRLEVRRPSERVAPGIIYTTILPKELLIFGQAKRYNRGAKIGRPDIQTFRGQLDDCINKYESNNQPPAWIITRD